MAGRKPPRSKERKRRIIFLAIIFASIAAMGGVAYFVYSSIPPPYVYRLAFRLRIIIGNPDNSSTRFAAIPPNIGVNPSLWNAHYLDSFGVNGRSPIYTLDDTGVVRVQSTVRFNYTLGDFFNIWGRFFNSTCIQVETLYCNNESNFMSVFLLVEHKSDTSFKLNSDYEFYMLQDQDDIRITYQPALPR